MKAPDQESRPSVQSETGTGKAAGEESLARQLVNLVKGDILVQTGLVVLVMTAALVIFVSVTRFPLEHTLAGILVYSLLPLLFVVGAIVFILSILRH